MNPQGSLVSKTLENRDYVIRISFPNSQHHLSYNVDTFSLTIKQYLSKSQSHSYLNTYLLNSYFGQYHVLGFGNSVMNKTERTALIFPITVEEDRKLIDNILFSKSDGNKCFWGGGEAGTG